MKVLSIIGARPQFVKEAIMQIAFQEANIEEVLVHTGQHYDQNMSEIFFDIFNMKKPKYNLGINGLSHGEMTGQMIIELEKIMQKENTEAIVLYGDTNSTLAGAIAASKMGIKIIHIEAGLRQNPKSMPEEINRVLTDRIATYLFTPSILGIENLKKEGIWKNVIFSGDVMYDVFLKMKQKFDYNLIDKLKLKQNEYIMMTLHRDFNVDNKFILEGILKEVKKITKEIKVVLPIHPRTQKRIQQFGLESYIKDIEVIEPIDYLSLMGLTEHCFKAITDSGGYQKETYFMHKQACVVMPDTCWRELIDCNWNTLSDHMSLYNDITADKKVVCPLNIYGEGNAAEKIGNYLKKNL